MALIFLCGWSVSYYITHIQTRMYSWSEGTGEYSLHYCCNIWRWRRRRKKRRRWKRARGDREKGGRGGRRGGGREGEWSIKLEKTEDIH